MLMSALRLSAMPCLSRSWRPLPTRPNPYAHSNPLPGRRQPPLPRGKLLLRLPIATSR